MPDGHQASPVRVTGRTGLRHPPDRGDRRATPVCIVAPMLRAVTPPGVAFGVEFNQSRAGKQ